jgi:GntR family transcriptional regulator/MocR family aminotransferase
MYIEIDRVKKVSYSRQIYETIRNKILSGELSNGEKLPSSRELSSSLKISRNVVLKAYELLELEGFIVIQEKSGTYVAKGANMPDSIFSPLVITDPLEYPTAKKYNKDYIDLRSGIPALDILPRRKWAQAYSNVYLGSDFSIFGYGEPNGLPTFRNSISNYLKRVRGLHCDPGQIIITNGSVHSFSLISSELLKDNNLYVIEDPLHEEIKKIFLATSSNFHCVPVDYSGMQTEYLNDDWMPRFIFCTPSHQYPLGGCLSIQRRIDLIQYAKRKNCYIIEDDYDSEFRYDGSPVSTLYNLAPDRVIYVGSFSKTLCPSSRLGYIIVPEELNTSISTRLRYRNYFIDTVTQLTMEYFLEERILEKHIKKIKKIYEKRRDYFILCLKKAFKENIIIHGDTTGLHFIVEFNNCVFDDASIANYDNHGLGIHPVWKHSVKNNYTKSTLIIFYPPSAF